MGAQGHREEVGVGESLKVKCSVPARAWEVGGVICEPVAGDEGVGIGSVIPSLAFRPFRGNRVDKAEPFQESGRIKNQILN